MYLLYTFILLAALIPCVLVLYIWVRFRNGGQNTPGEPPPPPQPTRPDPIEPPTSSITDPEPAPAEQHSEPPAAAVHAG